MTDDDKALVERLRGDWPETLVEKHWMMDSDAIDKQREEAADRIEALSAENERLREQLSGISGRLNIMREALIHTAGICNPASGFLKNASGVRKKHIENVCDVALAALGDTK